MTVPEPIDILARTLFGEARGEGEIGMKAVACVVMNRVKLCRQHPHFGDGTVETACKAPWQFSCWLAADPNSQIINDVDDSNPIFAEALDIALQAVNGTLSDMTDGATYYFVIGSPEPKWAIGKAPCAVIGHHAFYKDIA